MAGKNSRVIVKIREMILKGELSPGQRVREVELASKLGVSRTPVREALPILAAVIGGTAITIFVTAIVTNRFGQALNRKHKTEQIGEAVRDVSS